MNAFFMAINILVLLYIWFKLWHGLHLHICRIKLIDVRDEVHNYFIEHNLDLNSDDYKCAIDLLSIQIQYAKDASLLRAVIFDMFINKEIRKIEQQQEIPQLFSGLSLEHNHNIMKIFNKSVYALTMYMITKSFICLFLGVVITIFGRRTKTETLRTTQNVVRNDLAYYAQVA